MSHVPLSGVAYIRNVRVCTFSIEEGKIQEAVDWYVLYGLIAEVNWLPVY